MRGEPSTHRVANEMPGKNEAKRAAAAALADMDRTMTEEERQAMVRKGMGVGGGLDKGEERLAERKLTKEEKKAQTEARRASSRWRRRSEARTSRASRRACPALPWN